MGILVTKLIIIAVCVSATSAEVRSSAMTTDGIVSWAEAVIWTPWDTGFLNIGGFCVDIQYIYRM